MDAFLMSIGKTAELFGEAVSEARALLYFEALSDLPLSAVTAALGVACRTLTFFPKPSQLRDLAYGTADDRAASAWRRLLTAVALVGTGQSVEFGDPALHAAIEAMGDWPEMYLLERLDARELGFRRAEFARLYTAFSARPPDRVPHVLLGRHAIQNRLTRGAWTHGLGHVDPVFTIGASGEPVTHRALPAPATQAELSAPEEEPADVEVARAELAKILNRPAPHGGAQ